jgi:tetratricopeptide (TPR) repeat protein
MAGPADADALYRLALAACEQGRIEEGIDLARRAIAADASESRSHKLLGMALSRTGRNEDAVASLDRAIALGAATADVFGTRGDALAALGRREDALGSYDRAVAIGAGSVDDWCNRGVLLHDLGRHGDAVESFGRALALDQTFAPAHYNRGIALAALGRHAEAVACFDRAIAAHPGYVEAFNNRALALDQLGRREDALASVERALAIEPRFRDALVTQAIILRKLGRAEEALAACVRALGMYAEDAEALTVRGDVLIDLERFDDAIAAFDRVIALDPEAATPKWNKSLLCLGQGRFDEGWRLYEHRWQGARGLEPRPYPQPRWDGRRLDGPLLVWGEQGLGDEILHAGMMPDLLERTSPVLFECEPRLAPLFRRSFASVTVVPLQPPLYSGPIAAQVPLASLGGFFRRDWNSFPRRDRGYLLADEMRSRALRERLAGAGDTVIGLSWISKAPVGGEAKSARLKDFQPLLHLPGYRFVDLQYGDTRDERVAVERELGVRVERLDDIDNTNDLDGLAALMCACDAVVTVSNTTAHLAGALGVPTWVMVPFGQARIWYWFRDKDDSPWYPRVRVRRQQRGRRWDELVGAVAQEVAAFRARAR